MVRADEIQKKKKETSFFLAYTWCVRTLQSVDTYAVHVCMEIYIRSIRTMCVDHLSPVILQLLIELRPSIIIIILAIRQGVA